MKTICRAFLAAALALACLSPAASRGGVLAGPITNTANFHICYLLHSSSDLIHWTPTGDPFTAASESVTQEFDTGDSLQYVRVLELP